VPVTPFSLASGCPKNFSCWLIGDFSPSTWPKFFITKRSDAEGARPDHEHCDCRPACFLSQRRRPYHPAFATSLPTNATWVSFHWSCGLECTICRAINAIQVLAWILSVRWRSIALATMSNSIVLGRRLAAVPSLPPKKPDPEIRPSPLVWAVFPPEPSQTTCSAFTRSASSQQVLTLALFRPPQPNRERATPSPPRGHSAKVATRPPFASFLLSAVPDGAKTRVAADHLV